ncbi:hypothetical protein [Pseudomonas savastanoi]|uniref:Uncharacterized protein n=1 Tax=Pseudomonas savastanoi pv. savastanoi NCPPB 3335 TaxID=693985 RepID=A0ABC8BBG9_PSESS|nr:hypothetical protein [Pseudomonas savastanoi]ARD11077.1 hypothetical protein PSA3335_08390 [Pseudomonas savastanoi pv. savastanoi NCPPB 3335]MBA4705647.1 hypothetical protein [Pseudomonas savastanoi pv. savastanoi]
MPLVMVWEKKNIPRGDLQLLTKSNASGVLRLTQAGYGIDQTTYFRNTVFAKLNWQPVDDKEMASASFNLVIEERPFGIYPLDLSHKPSWESDQGNYTTGLHWGNAVGVIKIEGLIGKTLTLYEAQNENYQYQINIS